MRVLFSIFVTLTLLSACRPNTGTPMTKGPTDFVKISGSTMGTTYNLTVGSNNPESLKKEVDQLLTEINAEVNTYLDSSFITRFNRSEKGLTLAGKFVGADMPNRHFLMNYYRAKMIYDQTNGSFDPTVMPLVSYWGFAREKREVTVRDQKKIDSLRQYVGMNKVSLNETTRFLSKTALGVSLDFSAIAKGYGVDAICELFDRNNKADYFVEIGGEVRTKGKSPRKQPWIIGIATPDPNAAVTDLKTQVKLSGMALASSGNYRNYYEVEGQKYGHTIDPTTGLPKMTDILSASIFAEDCMTADAYATACMVMGVDSAYELISKTADVEGYFIFGKKDGTMGVKYTDGAAAFLLAAKIDDPF